MHIFVDISIIISNLEMAYTPFEVQQMVANGFFVGLNQGLNQGWHLMFVETFAKIFNTLALEMAKIVSVLMSSPLLIYCQIVNAMSHVKVIQQQNVVVIINGTFIARDSRTTLTVWHHAHLWNLSFGPILKCWPFYCPWIPINST